MSTTTRRLRWGVMGYARIARTALIPALAKARNSVLHAIASTDAAKLAQCRAAGLAPKYHSSYEELIRDPEIEAVYLPLPNSLHREWTIKAAAHGKHVLCEKPMGLTAAEAREMVVAAETHSVVLMEAFMYRYTPRVEKVVEVLKSGVLGEVKQVNSSFRFRLLPPSTRFKPELGGGSLYDVGCYPINFLGLVVDTLAGGQPGAGGQPEIVGADCVREYGVDMNFSALLRYPTGLMANIQSGFSTQRRVFSEIIGTEGVLEVPGTFQGEDQPLVLFVGDERREIPVPPSDRYVLEVEDFADAVISGRPPRFSLVETVRNAEVLDRLLGALP
jgi:xylose dehydrogenase (NAD/NADP)